MTFTIFSFGVCNPGGQSGERGLTVTSNGGEVCYGNEQCRAVKEVQGSKKRRGEIVQIDKEQQEKA
jgi:hypothetical protein